MEKFDEFKALIEQPKKIMITTHYKPDADALGSSLALKLYLEKKGHEVSVISPSDYPGFLTWMEGNDDVIIYSKDTKEQCEKIVEESDIVFCLDFSALHRIFQLGELVSNCDAVKVLIDHHRDPEKFADYELWNQDASATAELIYELIEMLGDNNEITVSIGECIYAGIMTDTGSFRFPSTSARVHMIIADLISKGVDNGKIHRLIYDNSTESRLRLLGFILSKKLKVLPEYHTAFIPLSRKELYRFNAQTGDTEGIVNYALSIKGIKFAALMKESDGIVKLSFRSIGDFGANTFASENFEGGGHKNAAGGRSTLSLEDTERKFILLLDKYKEELKASEE